TTLYDALVTLAKLLAPILPFVTETMYANLVRSVDPSAPISIHLCDWPQPGMARVDERALTTTSLAIDLVDAGRAARAAGNLKVRQPLARVRAHVSPRPGPAASLPPELIDEVRDELNVKAVEFVADVSELATYRVL